MCENVPFQDSRLVVAITQTLLVAILTAAFLALVRRHFMTLTLFS
ncbi:MAG: hypothetical protein ACUVRP_09860 [Chlorobiales bacterium]